MSKAVSAWFPLYVGDYLGDTQRLTTEQHGAYLLLMIDYWRNGPPPDDDAVLQQITKLDRSVWKKHRSALARMFQVIDGEWRHKRIEKELEAAAANSERRSSKAKTAAQARWGHATSNAPSMPQAMLGECPPPSPKNTPDKSGVATQRGNRLPADFTPPAEWIDWAEEDRGWSRAEASEEAASFTDYWHAKSGRDAVKLDWQATWRNWCRNSRRQARTAQPAVPL